LLERVPEGVRPALEVGPLHHEGRDGEINPVATRQLAQRVLAAAVTDAELHRLALRRLLSERLEVAEEVGVGRARHVLDVLAQEGREEIADEQSEELVPALRLPREGREGHGVVVRRHVRSLPGWLSG